MRLHTKPDTNELHTFVVVLQDLRRCTRPSPWRTLLSIHLSLRTLLPCAPGKPYDCILALAQVIQAASNLPNSLQEGPCEISWLCKDDFLSFLPCKPRKC